MKRLIKILSCVLLAVVALAGIGVWLLNQAINDHLTPPPNPQGQPSIASYATPLENSGATVDLRDQFSWEWILNPPASARPWTRWWWPGGDVDAGTAIEQLETLDAAGFGGVEIQPFLGGAMALVENDEVMARIYSFDSPAYYNTLKQVITAAHEKQLAVDLTHFSGWPPGGPEVNLEDSLTILAYGETTVKGGKRVDIELPKPDYGPSEMIFSMMEFAGADFINFPVAHAHPVSVVAARKVTGKHDWNPYHMDDTVILDQNSVQVLTGQIDGNRLRWEAPEGEWTIVASYLMPSGEVPMGAAQKPQGFVVDHLRVPQVIGHYEYAYGERTGLPEFYGKGLRGFFNDSLEFRLKRMAAHDILSEFKRRRGYNLEPYLPAIYIEGVDNVYFREILGVHAAPEFKVTEMDERIRHDYQQTLSDLVIERFIETSTRWAENRGLISRAQSYGMDIDILRALGSNTVPETEQLWAGGADVGLKFATSAAALYGKPLVSAESFVWINRDYMPTARRIKAAADKMFLAGVNHIIYHGTPYPWWGVEHSPFGEEGWQPFSSVGNPAHFSSHVNENNSALWPDIADLNRYISRVQYLLRQGAPEIDVLIYYPFLGFLGPNPAESNEALVGGALPDADPKHVATEDPMLTSGKKMMDNIMTVPHHQKDPRSEWVEDIQPLLRELDRKGISWGWVNEHALSSGSLAKGELKASGGKYKAVLVYDTLAMESRAVDALRMQAEQGVPVVFVGKLPRQQASFLNAEAGDKAVQASIETLIESGRARHYKTWSDDVEQLIANYSQSVIDYRKPSEIKRHRRVLPEGQEIHFYANQSPQSATLTLNVSDINEGWWFDALTGESAPFNPSKASITLAGFESKILVLGKPLPAAQQSAPAIPTDTTEVRALRGWEFNSGDYKTLWSTLPDWRTIEPIRYAAKGRYQHRITLGKPESGKRYQLELGLVQGSAHVRVNGVAIGQASLPPFRADIGHALKTGENLIEIDVRAPLRNVFVGKALAGDPQYSHMLRYENQLVAAGVIGDISLRIVE